MKSVSHPDSITSTRPSATAAGAAPTQLSFLCHMLFTVLHCKSPKCPVLIENWGCWAGGEGAGGGGGRHSPRHIRYIRRTWLCTIFTSVMCFIPECLVEEQLRVTVSKWTVLAASVTSHRKSEPKSPWPWRRCHRSHLLQGTRTHEEYIMELWGGGGSEMVDVH